MNAAEQAVLKDLVPVAAYGLNLACPLVPAFVWSSLISALLNGDISVEALQKFMTDNNIKTYTAPTDYPGNEAHSGSL